MSKILFGIVFVVSTVLLVIGVIFQLRNKGRPWIFLSLSALCLLTGFILIPLSDREKNDTTIIEHKENDNKNKDIPDENQESPKDPGQTAAGENTSPDNSPINYKVVKGDCLWAIAKRANVTVAKIKEWNNLTSDIIYVHQVLKLYDTSYTIIENAPSILITQGNLQQKEIAFTFDAGSDTAGIQILDVLKKHNVKATFFLTGQWVKEFPNDAKRIADEGHEIGNATYSHRDAAAISSSTFMKEINKAEQIIETTSGISPRPYFRFPNGSYTESALQTVGKAGYPYSIQWSLDTIDWQQPSADVIVSRITSGAGNGDIVLMHIGSINTPEAVDRVIPILQSRGYQIVTLSQILN